LGGESNSRLEFAQWLTKPGSRAAGLVARVQANRLWQACFGRGLAAASENLGLSGEAPTHPELLEWLACDLVDNGWSEKELVRKIVCSAAFRRAIAQSDDERMWLAGYGARRLEAEAIRDSLLAASGELDETMFGRPTPTERTPAGEVLAPEASAGARRRSIYLRQRRTEVPSMLQVFDAPSIVYNSVRRPISAMPLQSLTLLNSEFVLARADALAKRALDTAAGDGNDERIQFVYGAVLSRRASDEELAEAREFLASQSSAYGNDGDAPVRSWRDFCQSLLATSEFLYVE
jgi:hypothetical protein